MNGTQEVLMELSRQNRIAFFTSTIFFLVVTVLPPAAPAQSYTLLHEFGGPDGKNPVGTLVMDAAGNLYGTTSGGGINEYGTVFMMTKNGSGWNYRTLYRFMGGSDGSDPCSGVTIGPDGGIYGTTSDGHLCGPGNPAFDCNLTQGCGTVFRLTPPVTASASLVPQWKKTVIYRFHGGSEGYDPLSRPVFDQQGNIYGTTAEGGITTCSRLRFHGWLRCGL